MTEESKTVNDTHKSGDDPEAALNSDAEGPKPSYQTTVVPIEKKSFVRKVREAQQNASGPVEGARNVIEIFWSSIGDILILLIHNLFPIAMIVIGWYYIGRENCKPEDLAVLMLVGGIGFLLRGLLDTYRRFRLRRSGSEDLKDGLQKTLDALSHLGSLFGLAWTIAAWVIVFRLWGHVSYDKDSEYYCNQVLMLFSFWVVLLPFIILGIVLLIFCFFGLCMCCLAVATR